MNNWKIAAFPATFALVSLAVACGGGGADGHGAAVQSMGMVPPEGPAGSIAVRLQNWSVSPARSSVAAGEVTFHAVHVMEMHSHNEGGAIHELAVARRLDDGQLQIGKTGELRMGESADLTLALTPGDYDLRCNIVEELGKKVVSHYRKGMHTNFTVQ